jgi:hypothetical protein
MYTSTWQKQITKTQVGKKGGIWEHQMSRTGGGFHKSQEPPNTSCFTYLDEQTASVDETLRKPYSRLKGGNKKADKNRVIEFRVFLFGFWITDFALRILSLAQSFFF